ncbi:MAG: hypothetical protein EOO90_18470 [Pedobacter sp.]|nr:MAG: hypothetical protein EOO90_18470 [Pedobacter sp.]
MKTRIEQPSAAICTFTWIGFVCAISFMEAWLKFRAPGITLPLGLGIGRLVFAALNKVEWVFAIAIIISTIRSSAPVFHRNQFFLFFAIAILIMQTLWLLPALDARAELYITNKPVEPSSLHLYFAIAEVIKVSMLFTWGVTLFKRF